MPLDADAAGALPLDHSLAAVVVRTGRPQTSEDISTDPTALDVSRLPDWPRLGPAVVVPLRSGQAVPGPATSCLA